MLQWIDEYTFTNVYFLASIPFILFFLWIVAFALTLRAGSKDK